MYICLLSCSSTISSTISFCFRVHQPVVVIEFECSWVNADLDLQTECIWLFQLLIFERSIKFSMFVKLYPLEFFFSLEFEDILRKCSSREPIHFITPTIVQFTLTIVFLIIFLSFGKVLCEEECQCFNFKRLS